MTAPTQQQQTTNPPAPVPPAPGQPQDQNQQQPGQGQQGQTGQPPAPNPWAGLLDVAPPQGGQQPGQGQQFPGGQFGQFPPAGPAAGPGFDPQQMADLIGRAVTSAVDRRVNQMTNPQWQQAHGGQQAQPPQQGAPPQPYQAPQQGAPQSYQYQAPAGPSEADQREARMAAREYLGDRITFGSEAERAMAVDLTSALIPSQLIMGMSPNQAALLVAQTVADRVTALRRSYEDQAVRGLRARGLLNETPQGPPQLSGSVGVPMGGTPGGTANQQSLIAKANKMKGWADEENAARGWNTKQAATA